MAIGETIIVAMAMDGMLGIDRASLALTKLDPPVLTSGSPFDRRAQRDFLSKQECFGFRGGRFRGVKRPGKTQGTLVGALTKQIVPVFGRRA